VAFRVRTVRDLDEFRTAVGAIGHYFGWQPTEEDGQRFSRMLPFDRMHAVLDDGSIVGGAGVLPLELTVPDAVVACAGVTVIGVLPSHRRRGLLNRMMRAQLDDVRARGEPVAALWASEETIYGRYGYGLASLQVEIRLPRVWSGFRADVPPREASARLVDHAEALRTFPRVYERVRPQTAGFLSRSPDWWELRKLDDDPEHRRGGGPLNRVLFERGGRAVGYALYRVVQDFAGGEWRKTLRVLEAIGIDAPATRDVWRFLIEIDWMDEIECWLLPVDHPVQLLVARVNRLALKVQDGLWFRLVDVPAALSARGYGTDESVTIEVTSDPQFAENVGTWAVATGEVRRARRRPDMRVDVQALGSAYLGGFTFTQLARAGRAVEVARGGLGRADAAFRVDSAPWCPDMF
jgi:predicted acetyltransferase